MKKLTKWVFKLFGIYYGDNYEELIIQVLQEENMLPDESCKRLSIETLVN